MIRESPLEANSQFAVSDKAHIPKNRKMLFRWLGAIVGLVSLATVLAEAGTTTGSLTFSNTPLLRPEGESEPAISIAGDGTLAVTGLQWLFNPTFFCTHLWTGPFRSTPTLTSLDYATT